MKTTVNSNVIMFTSALTAEQIATISKYDPHKLILTKKEDNGRRTDIYSIDVGNAGTGSIGAHGIVFDGITRDNNKNATLALDFIYDGEDVAGEVFDRYGKYIRYAEAIETQCLEAIDGILEAKKTFIENVEVQ